MAPWALRGANFRRRASDMDLRGSGTGCCRDLCPKEINPKKIDAHSSQRQDSSFSRHSKRATLRCGAPEKAAPVPRRTSASTWLSMTLESTQHCPMSLVRINHLQVNSLMGGGRIERGEVSPAAVAAALSTSTGAHPSLSWCEKIKRPFEAKEDSWLDESGA